MPRSHRSLVGLTLGLALLTGATATAQRLTLPLDDPRLGATHTPPGSQDAPRFEARQDSGIRGRIVPNRLVVRFDDSLAACVSTAFEPGAVAPKSVSALTTELRNLGVAGVRAVHRTSAEQAALRQGRDVVSLDQLLGHHRRKVEQVVGRRGLAPEKLAGLPALHHVYTLELADGADAQGVLDALGADSRVRWIEPLRLFTTEALPDDPLVDPDGDGEWQRGSWGQDHPDQWALQSMEWATVWDQRETLWSDPQRVGGGGVTIAIVDTGVDYEHPDLAANIWRDSENRPGMDFVDIDVQTYVDDGFVLVDGEDYTEIDHDPMDRQGHGTHVAGIAGATADDGFGMAGVAWGATILPVRAGFALDVGGGSTIGALEADDIAAAITWAAEAGADILNFSFGGSSDAAITDAVVYAHALGTLMVASAGNADVDSRSSSPANEAWVIAVGASDVTGAKAAFSNWGERLDLVAPGKDIVSARAAGTNLSGTDAWVGEHHILASGTSMAAPQVAGALALILSAHPAADYEDRRGRLLGTSRPMPRLLPGHDALQALGAGIPDLAAALTDSPRTHTVLRAVEITPDDPDFHDLGGNTTLGAGAGAALTIDLRNVWRSADATSFTLVSHDPHVEVTSGPTSTAIWPNHGTGRARAHIVVADDTPRYHRPDLRLRIASGGASQDITIPLEVHGSRSVSLVPENYDAGYTTDFQLHSAVDGRILATWSRFLAPVDRYEVRGGFFDLDGNPIGESFLLHDEDVGMLFGNVVADRRDDGQWVAAWRRLLPLGDNEFDTSIGVQRFDADGNRVGSRRIIVDEATTITQDLTVALADDGTVAVGWWGIYRSNDTTVRTWFFDPDGQPIGEIQDVEAFGFGTHSSPAFAFGPENRLLTTWRAHFGRTPEGDHDIRTYARIYDIDGTPLSDPFQVSQEHSRFNLDPRAGASDDGFVVVWDWCDNPASLGGTGTCGIRGRRVDASGAMPGDELVLEPADDHTVIDARLLVEADGSFAATWDACLPTSFLLTGCEIRARRFDADDRSIGGLFRVDAMNALLGPSLARADDEFLVSWSNSGSSPHGNWGQFFLFDGAPDLTRCVADADALCLQTERFEVEVEWRDFDGQSGTGLAQPLAGTTGYFSFFDPNNIEILVKVLDGRDLNGHWWVFTASLSNVEYRLRVRDTTTGTVRVYDNPAGQFASRGDVLAFAEAGRGARPSIARPSTKTTELVLHDRFRVEIAWRDFAGVDGTAGAVPLTDDSGAFWFFDAENVELVIKVLDGRSLNGHWWVFFGALSNVAYTVTITDTETGTVRTYDNPLGNFASRGDTLAF